MIVKFRAKPVGIGGSIGVTIPRAYFQNELLDKNKEYEFQVCEIEEQKTNTREN